MLAPCRILSALAVFAVLAVVAKVFNSLWETALQRLVPPAALSRVSAYDRFGSLAFAPVGLAVAGPAAAAFGTSATLWAATAGSLLTAVICVATPSVRAVEA